MPLTSAPRKDGDTMLPLAFGFAIAITIFALAFWFAHDPGRDSTAITKRQEETTGGNVYIVLPPAQPAQPAQEVYHTHTHYHAHITVQPTGQPTGQPYDNRQRRIASGPLPALRGDDRRAHMEQRANEIDAFYNTHPQFDVDAVDTDDRIPEGW